MHFFKSILILTLTQLLFTGSVFAEKVEVTSTSMKAENLKKEAEEEKLTLDICRADITSPKGRERLFDFMGTDKNSLSGMVHCAATGVHKPIEKNCLRCALLIGMAKCNNTLISVLWVCVTPL